ncbi:MAG: hypothetical protein M3540_08670 [Actinomycetota bacterium]|nr:hypothetical protein [Actinomycetota bacterium]
MSLLRRWNRLRSSEKLGLALAAGGIGVSVAIFAVQELEGRCCERKRTVAGMRSTEGWVPYSRAGSSVGLRTSADGKGPFSLAYSVGHSGWVGITKAIPAGVLSGTERIEFDFKGTGAPNSVEFKLIYPADGGAAPIFGSIWRHATDTEGDWRRVRVLRADFSCWPRTGCREGEPLDPGRVVKIDFAVSNKPEGGDVAGRGSIAFKDVVAVGEG